MKKENLQYTDEQARIKVLEELAIVDTPPEESYDQITWLACEFCEMPIAIVNLLYKEKQWFKSRQGISIIETPRKLALCNYTVESEEEITIVPDCRLDDRFKDNPLVTESPFVVFYAGVPLVYTNGVALGTLCVIDLVPNQLTGRQKKALKIMAAHVVKLLELRAKNQQLKQLSVRNESLKSYAYKTAHDLKSPLNHISGITSLLSEQFADRENGETNEQLRYLQQASTHLRNLIDEILRYSADEELLNKEKSWVQLPDFLNELVQLLDAKHELKMHFPPTPHRICINKTALEQILLNLMTNAIRHNDKDIVEISFGFKERKKHYEFSIEDNGPGIPDEIQTSLFQPFVRNGSADRFGNTTTGIGLATVQQLVHGLGGKIKVHSAPNKGARFKFTLPKPDVS